MTGEDFVALVRSNDPSMDKQLAGIFNQNMTHCIERAYDRAFFFHKRQRDFSRKSMASFFAEFNEIRERVTKLGYFGQYLDEICADIYTNNYDAEAYVKKVLTERKERQEAYANTPKPSGDKSKQQSLLKD